jgi:multisubunit Na+/H+ antiporter MnhG subunit
MSTFGSISVFLGVLILVGSTDSIFNGIILIILGLLLSHTCFYSAVKRKVRNYIKSDKFTEDIND